MKSQSRYAFTKLIASIVGMTLATLIAVAALFGLAALGAYLAGQSVFANTADTLTSGTNLFTAGDWSGSALPTSTSDVEFASGYPSAPTTVNTGANALVWGTLNDLNANAITATDTASTAGSITLDGGSNSVSITAGGSASDLIFVQSGGSLTVSSTTGDGAMTLNLNATGNIDNAGTLLISAPVSITGGDTITFTGSGSTTISGAIDTAATTGSINVNTTGSGSVTLSGAIGYTGTTSITSGKLILAAASGTDTLYASTNGGGFVGNLVIQTAIRVNFDSGTFSGGGQIQVQTTGTNLTNSNKAPGPGTVSNAIFLNSTGITFTAGTFASASPFYTPSATFVTSIGGTTSSNSTLPITFAGVISGNSDVIIANSTAGGGGGPVALGSSSIAGGSTGYETYTGNTIFSGNGVVTLANTNILPVNTNVLDAGSGTGTPTLAINGFNQAFASLSDAATISGAKVLTIENANATSATLTVGSSLASAQPRTDFSGVIKDGTGGGALALVKTGTNTVGLAGANTYSGGTTISGGILVVDGSLASSAPVSVQSGGTLGGIGTVGPVSLLSGGTLSPGSEMSGNATGTLTATTGTLAAAALTWNSGATLAFDLSPSGASSLLNLTGALTEGTTGGPFQFNFLGGGLGNTTYTLIDFSSTSFISASAFTATNLGTGVTGFFTLNSTDLTFTASGGSPPANVVWAVNNGVGTWDTTTGNWSGGNPVANRFKTGDNATFDDTHSGTAGDTVTIQAGGVSPGSTTVNTAGTYTFQNTGGDTNGISGTGSLTIDGSGKVILTSPNTYTGGTIVSVGTLQISADNQLGGSSGTLSIDNATLAITSSITGMNRALTLGVNAGDPATIATNGDNLANAGTTAINGLLTTTGTGDVAFNGAVTLGASASFNANAGSITLGQLSGTLTLVNGATIAQNLIVGAAGSASTTRVNFDNGNFNIGQIEVQSSGTRITNSSTAANPASVSAGIFLNSANTTFTPGVFTALTSSSYYTYGSFVVSIGGTTSSNSSVPLTFSGVISGNSDVVIANSTTGGGGGPLVLGSASVAGGSAGYDTYTGNTVFSGNGTVTLANTNVLPATTNVMDGASSSGAPTLVLNGFNQTVASLSDSYTVSGSNFLTIENKNTTPATLTVGSTLSTAQAFTDFSGAIKDGAGSSPLTLVKSGTNTVGLAGANTYTGGTTITGGALLVDGSLAASSTVTVQSGGTLGGIGSVGAVTLQSGGTLSPGLEMTGNTIGTLTAAGLTWNSGATLAFELSGSSSASSLLSLGSSLLTEGTTGGPFQFNFLGGGLLNTTYTLINFGSTTFTSSSVFSATDLASGLTGFFTLNSVDLTFTVTNSASLPANVVWAANNGVGVWNTTTGNWTGGSPTANLFKTNDFATFDDTHSGTHGGTVTIQTGGVSPGSTTVNTAGTYTFQNTGNDTNGISGNGSLTIAGSGKVILTSPNTYTGGTAVIAGTLQISADNQLGASSGPLVINGGATLAITSSITGMNRALTVGVNGGTISTGGNSVANAGTTTINGALATSGTSNVALNGAVTFGVNTTSSQYGSLNISTGGSVTFGQLSGAISFGNGSTINGNLDIGVAGQTSATRVNFNNSSGSSPGVTGTGSINILSSGTSISNASATLGDTVSTNIAMNSSDPTGTFFTKGNVAASTYTPGSFVTTIGGTTAPANGTIYGVTINSVISGASDLNIAGGGGATAGGGSGTLYLGGQNTYTGTTTFNLNNGTLQLMPNPTNQQPLNNVLPATTNFIFGTQSGANGAAVFDLNGDSQQFASLSYGTAFGSKATFTIQNSGGAVGNASILTVSGSVTPANDFAGVIEDGIWGISLVKGGSNTLALSGANTYTGATTVTGGTLLLDFSQNTTQVSNILYDGGFSPSSLLSIGGATLALMGGSGVSNVQSLDGIAATPGGSTIFLNQNGASSLELVIGALTHTQGGVVNFSVIPQSSGVVATTTTSNVNGILGTWATVGSGTTLAYATQGAGGEIGAYTGTAAATAAALTDTTGMVNYDLSAATGTVQSTVSANSIRYLGSGGTTTPGATSFTVNGLMNGGSGLWAIAANSITIGANKELDIVTNTQGIAISSAIKNNGLGASVVTTSGNGTVTLSGANTYTGGTFLDGGILALGAAQSGTVSGPMGASGPIYFGGGTLQYSASNTTDYSSRFSAAANQEVSINTGGQNVAFAAALTSVGDSLNKTGAGNLTLSATNTYSGGTTVNGGALLVNGSVSGSATVQSGGTLGGTGSAGNVEVQSGGSLEPGLTNSGPSTGVLAASSLLWDGGGELLFDLSTTTNASSELSLGTGVLSEGAAGQYTFNFLGGGKAGDTYDLINFGSTDFASASDFSATNLGSGLAANFTLTSNELEVQIMAPEPSAWAALALGAGMLVGLRRFRRGVRA